MKKLIELSLVMLCLITMLAMPVIAVPQMPYILYGNVEYQGSPLDGARLEVVYQGTHALTTESTGNWIYQLQSYTPGETVTLRVVDGCGSGDICQKNIVIGSAGNEDFAVVDFSLTGTLACPTCVCSSCSSSGGSSSSDYFDFATEERCDSKFPCVATECAKPEEYCGEIEALCPTELSNICELTNGDNCPPEVICPECVTDEEKDDAIASILTVIFTIIGGIIGLVLGKYSWFAGFKGLSEYRIKEGIKAIRAGDYEKAKTQLGAAFKMFKTSLEKAEEGSYEE